jgi:predicted Zn-dependent peptidase
MLYPNKLGGNMGKNKNITNKEIRRRFDFLANYMTQLGDSVKSISDLLLAYIEFGGEDEKFKEYLNDLIEAQAKKNKEEAKGGK